MGCHDNITYERFPKQGDWLGKRVDVCFHYDSSRTIGGTIVREDEEAPWLCIIRLDDGRHVLTTECQHTMPRDPAPAERMTGRRK
jgi:hypothetical protein